MGLLTQIVRPNAQSRIPSKTLGNVHIRRVRGRRGRPEDAATAGQPEADLAWHRMPSLDTARHSTQHSEIFFSHRYAQGHDKTMHGFVVSFVYTQTRLILTHDIPSASCLGCLLRERCHAAAGECNALDTPYRDDVVQLPVSPRVTFSSNGMLRRPEVDSIGLEGMVSVLGKVGRHSAHEVLHGYETHQLKKHRQVLGTSCLECHVHAAARTRSLLRSASFLLCLSVCLSAHPSVHHSLSTSPATHFARA